MLYLCVCIYITKMFTSLKHLCIYYYHYIYIYLPSFKKMYVNFFSFKLFYIKGLTLHSDVMPGVLIVESNMNAHVKPS